MERINIENLDGDYFDGGGEKLVYFYQGERFTGIAVEYYEDGVTVLGEEEYHNGYQDGWIRYYFESGQLETEYRNVDNQIVAGTYKEYNESGTLILEG